nr:regulator of G-protein signaling loco isoform X2 [Leptinotarsa decemlineata]
MTKCKVSSMDKFCKSYGSVIFSVIYEKVRDGNHMGAGLVVAMRPSFKRINSFRRSGSQRLPRRPASIYAPPDVVPQFDQNVFAKCTNPEGPVAWAQSFEKLLEDSLGLHMFAEFLKKEFSAENIYFWTACERFKKLPPGIEKQAEARRIYEQHLSVGSLEAVNVDSQGRQFTEQVLQEMNNNMFDQAQKQIFNLMKFDSYPRFLKSDIYKQCLLGEVDKATIDTRLLLEQQQKKSPSKLMKSVSNAEDRRRKSLLPWHRKNRSKSRDRGESEYAQRENDETVNDRSENYIVSSGQNDVHSSGSSSTSLEFVIINQDSDNQAQATLEKLSSNGAKTALCRVILNNGTTTVVKIKESETIQELVTRVLERKGLSYSSFEVLTDKHEKCLDVNEPSSKLTDCEVTVEQRVVFKLDLPNRKTINIRSKYTKIIIEVLRPSLHKYQYNLDQVIVMNGKSPIDLHLPVTSIDGMRLKVLLCEGSRLDINSSLRLNSNKVTKLEEITNRVFESILQEKSDSSVFKQNKSEKGSVKSEDWGSEHSSTFIGKFLRRDSGLHDRKKKMIAKKLNSNEDTVIVAGSDQCPNKKPLVAKLRAGASKLHVTRSESDELVEGLSRAQRRLEDQRGTEINFELPDFLKNKEGDCQTKPQVQTEPDRNSLFYLAESTSNSQPERAALLASAKNLKQERQSNYENRYVLIRDKIVDDSLKSPPFISSSEETSSSNQSTPAKSSLNNTVIENNRHGDPPPLPPKPKIVPIKPKNWGQAMFLEQTSSSFV